MFCVFFGLLVVFRGGLVFGGIMFVWGRFFSWFFSGYFTFLDYFWGRLDWAFRCFIVMGFFF